MLAARPHAAAARHCNNTWRERTSGPSSSCSSAQLSMRGGGQSRGGAPVNKWTWILEVASGRWSARISHGSRKWRSGGTVLEDLLLPLGPVGRVRVRGPDADGGGGSRAVHAPARRSSARKLPTHLDVNHHFKCFLSCEACARERVRERVFFV